MPSFTPLELIDDVVGGLHLLVIIAGGVLAVVTWRRQPRVALFTVLGLAALAVAYLIWLVEIFVLPALPAESVEPLVTTISVVTAVARIAGFVLILLALIRRRQVTGGMEARR